jgi:hypothetical protein
MFCVQWFKKFLLNGTQIVKNRSESHMKTFASVADHQVWSLGAQEQRKHFLKQIEGSTSCGRVGFKCE